MARDSAADSGALSSAAERAIAWLTADIDADGCIGGRCSPGYYFKVPAALALNGRRGTAALVLDWIAVHLLRPTAPSSCPTRSTAPVRRREVRGSGRPPVATTA